jgi:signal transduction histidine kinase
MVGKVSLLSWKLAGALRRVVIVVILLFPITCIVASTTQGNRHVLFISSYSLSFHSALEQYAGVMSVLHVPNVVVDVDYMDSKRFPGEDNVASYERRLKFILPRLPRYDAIIASDDAALHFVIDRQHTLFKGIPIFFFGLENVSFGLSLNKNPLVTGLLEVAPFEGTLHVIQKLYPHANKIYVINDHSASGYNNYLNMMHAVHKVKNLHVEVFWSDDYSYDDFCKLLSRLDPKVPMLLLSAYQDKNNRTFNFKEVVEMLRTHFRAPVFYPWSSAIKYGTFGGEVISHYDQGRGTALLLSRYFAGADISKMKTIERAPYCYMFDYKQLQEFHIDENKLPGGSILVGKPVSFYEQNKNVVLSTLVFIVILVCLVFFLVRLNIQRKKAAIELRASKDMAVKGECFKNEFIRNLSDEIKVPLDNLVTNSNKLSPNPEDKEKGDICAQAIQGDVAQLSVAVRKAMELLSLDDNNKNVNIEKCSVNNLLKCQWLLYYESAAQKGLETVFDNVGDIDDITLSTDVRRLTKMVSYLLECAISFTSAGSIHLGCYLEDEMLVIYVKDTGRGMSKKLQQSIFGPSTVEVEDKYDSVSLGLIVVRSMARLLGGELSIEFEVGKGSSLFIKLPYNDMSNL